MTPLGTGSVRDGHVAVGFPPDLCDGVAGGRVGPVADAHTGSTTPAHNPCVLANLPSTGEPVLFEKFDGRPKQETALRLAAGGHLGDGPD